MTFRAVRRRSITAQRTRMHRFQQDLHAPRNTAHLVSSATIIGSLLAWVMLMSSFLEIAYSMMERADKALDIARQAAPATPVTKLEDCRNIIIALILGYILLGAVVIPCFFWRYYRAAIGGRRKMKYITLINYARTLAASTINRFGCSRK